MEELVCSRVQDMWQRRWVRLWLSCLVVGGCLFLGGGALRAVAVFSVFRPFTVELNSELTQQERLQSYRIAVAGTPYVWAGGVLFFVGLSGLVFQNWRHLRQYGWLVMAMLLALLALPAELWLLARFDVPLVRLFASGLPPLEGAEQIVLERVRRGGAVATLASFAEWTILLLVIWRPLERAAHEA